MNAEVLRVLRELIQAKQLMTIMEMLHNCPEIKMGILQRQWCRMEEDLDRSITCLTGLCKTIDPDSELEAPLFDPAQLNRLLGLFKGD